MKEMKTTSDGAEEKTEPDQLWLLPRPLGRDGCRLLDQGDMKGTTIIAENNTGDVISLSTRYCREKERWKCDMPSLESFSKSLQTIDLYNSRYIEHIHHSIGLCDNLVKLELNRCDALITLPKSIGQLENLQEVRAIIVISTNTSDLSQVSHKPFFPV